MPPLERGEAGCRRLCPEAQELLRCFGGRQLSLRLQAGRVSELAGFLHVAEQRLESRDERLEVRRQEVAGLAVVDELEQWLDLGADERLARRGCPLGRPGPHCLAAG